MARAFLIVLDSVGCGGAPDACDFFNGDLPDTGANTLGHILAKRGLNVPNLDALGLGAAMRLSTEIETPGLDAVPYGRWGVAREISQGKDTPLGHWELAGLPVPWEWTYFPDATPAFPDALTQALCRAAGTEGILCNAHSNGIKVIDDFGEEHLKSGWPICYTSADSVLQIAAHEEVFGYERLLQMCREIAPILHDMRVGRVIARPFVGTTRADFKRTPKRRDFAISPPEPVLTNWVQDAGGTVHGVGKIGDIFSMAGIDTSTKGPDIDLMHALDGLAETAGHGDFVFANLVEFDTDYGHRRDVEGYGAALERFDVWLGQFLPRLAPDDLLILTADHGNDPSWPGTDHTREQVPVLVHGAGVGEIGVCGFVDVGASIAAHLGAKSHGIGRSFL
ncbi:phosphopentomutase [Planktotalea sp.]|uniref:phosphopentomutase n=1 Tax=Planktotalea sp. TaxID=2029877 RepID=UPI0025CF88CA|nr:phosphopentomutase [Planktotalea sp.]